MMTFALAVTLVAAMLTIVLRGAPEQAVAAQATKAATESSVEPLIRGERPPDPWVEKQMPLAGTEVPKSQTEREPSEGGSIPQSRPASEPEPGARPEPELRARPNSEPESRPQSEPLPSPEPRPESRSEPEPLPTSESGWQRPTQEEIGAASEPRHYDLPSGAIMGLTIGAIGIYNAPVFDSDSQWALANGVAHVPETSLPWSPTPQRNVYLAGHRMGYRGTWSRMIFYNLDKLGTGDEVLLKDRDGGTYRYRVSEVLVTDPADTWVMGQVRGRDMLTLQTCTPIPTFEKRLIVRADRV